MSAPTSRRGRAREAMLRISPPVNAAEPDEREWIAAASLRRRVVARPWEGGHSLAWLIWALGALATVLQTDNPLYLALLWGVATLVWTACAGDGPLARSFYLMIALGGWIFAMHIVFSVITAGFLRGAHVLITLPTLTLPRLLGGLQLGGGITAEQLVSGATRGLRLWTLLLLLGAFNACVNHYRLLRRSPRFLFQAGLVITIGLAFVPQTVLRLRAIREAQRLRGHRFRGWRDALPLFVPLLSGGLERALNLAEAMESRGYGRSLRRDEASSRVIGRLRLLALAGLAGLMLGCFAFLFYPSGTLASRLGLAAIAGSAGLILAGWRRAGQFLSRTTYNRERWSGGDRLVALAAVAAPAGLWLLGRAGLALSYPVFPRVGLPPFDIRLALPLLLLAAPAVCWGRIRDKG
ncbi:MAG TPA: energy-coupling factor transporter transmembrane component T [Herpetosiphonaceae bacterium]|nr:energy-coupling factor transporter transmembrane component T [Herpetosiphonaceae bacterium]